MRLRTKLSGAVFLVACVLCGLAGLLYLRSEGFQTQARRYLRARIEQATGMQCSIGKLGLDVWRGRFKLSALVLEPRNEDAGFLWLRTETIEGRLRIRSIWHLTADLEYLDIERPQIRIVSGSERRGPGGVGVQRVLSRSLSFATHRISLHQGELLLDQRRIPLDLSLEDFACDLSHQEVPAGYNAALSYRKGTVVYAGRQIEHGLTARFRLMESGLQIDAFEVKRQQSEVKGHGFLGPWDAPTLTLMVNGTVFGPDFRLLDSDFAGARGRIDVTADLRWDSRGISMQGRFSMPSTDYRHARLRGAEGQFQIRDRALELVDVQGNVGSGRFKVSGTVQLSRAIQSPHALKLTVTGVSMTDGASILGLPRLALQNKVDATADLRWREGISSLDLSADVYLHGIEDSVASGGLSTALDGELALGLASGVWDVRKVRLHSPHSNLQIVQGADKECAAHLVTDRPEELLRMARRIIPDLDGVLIEYPDLLGLEGSYDLQGNLPLDFPDRFAFAGQARVSRGRWGGFEAESLQGRLEWAGDTVKLGSLEVRNGRESLEGQAQLRLPASEGQPFDYEVQGSARELSLDGLRALGLEVPAGLKGTLSASGEIALRHGKTSGSGNIRLEHGSYNETEFDQAAGEIGLEGDEVRIRRGRLTRGVATVDGSGTFNVATREMDITGRLVEVPLQDLPAVKANHLELDGLLDATATARGTLANPSIDGKVELRKLRFSSWDLGLGRGEARLRGKSLSLQLTVQSQLGELQASATLSIEPGFQGTAEVTLKDWNLERMIQSGAPRILSGLSTALQGRVDIEGSFADPASLRARGELDGARFRIQEYELQNRDKIRFSVADQRLRFESAQLVGEGSSLVLGGQIPISREPVLDLTLRGQLNLRSLPRLVEGAAIGGNAQLDVKVGGSLWDPQIVGQATLQALNLRYEDIPFQLSDGQGRVTFSANAIALENIRGNIATGNVTVNGIVEHANAELRGINLQIDIRRARLPYPQGFRTTIDASLVLRGDRNSQVLVGNVNVVRADYVSEFNLLEELLGRASAPASPQAAGELLANLSLNVAVTAPDSLYIDNQLANVRGRANLLVRGSLQSPSITGRVEAVDGTVFFRGNRFDILRASADFTELKPLNPNLDVRAEADIKKYRLRLDVTGDLHDPRLNLTSDPALPTMEIVLLLTTGFSPEDTTDTTGTELTDEQVMKAGAASLLSAGLTGALDQRVSRLFGLQSFRVDPYWVGSTQDPTARVTISERLTKDVTVTYSRNLTTSEEQVVIVEYSISRNLSLVASQDEKGDFGIDIRLRRRLR